MRVIMKPYSLPETHIMAMAHTHIFARIFSKTQPRKRKLLRLAKSSRLIQDLERPCFKFLKYAVSGLRIFNKGSGFRVSFLQKVRTAFR